jgi:hypothetical protein
MGRRWCGEEVDEEEEEEEDDDTGFVARRLCANWVGSGRGNGVDGDEVEEEKGVVRGADEDDKEGVGLSRDATSGLAASSCC